MEPLVLALVGLRIIVLSEILPVLRRKFREFSRFRLKRMYIVFFDLYLATFYRFPICLCPSTITKKLQRGVLLYELLYTRSLSDIFLAQIGLLSSRCLINLLGQSLRPLSGMIGAKISAIPHNIFF